MRIIDTVEKRHPFIIRQRVAWDAKIDASSAKVGEKNAHYAVERE